MQGLNKSFTISRFHCSYWTSFVAYRQKIETSLKVVWCGRECPSCWGWRKKGLKISFQKSCKLSLFGQFWEQKIVTFNKIVQTLKHATTQIARFGFEHFIWIFYSPLHSMVWFVNGTVGLVNGMCHGVSFCVTYVLEFTICQSEMTSN